MEVVVWSWLIKKLVCRRQVKSLPAGRQVKIQKLLAFSTGLKINNWTVHTAFKTIHSTLHCPGDSSEINLNHKTPVMERFNMFNNIHKALRVALYQNATLLQQTDFLDEENQAGSWIEGGVRLTKAS